MAARIAAPPSRPVIRISRPPPTGVILSVTGWPEEGAVDFGGLDCTAAGSDIGGDASQDFAAVGMNAVDID